MIALLALFASCADPVEARTPTSGSGGSSMVTGGASLVPVSTPKAPVRPRGEMIVRNCGSPVEEESALNLQMPTGGGGFFGGLGGLGSKGAPAATAAPMAMPAPPPPPPAPVAADAVSRSAGPARNKSAPNDDMAAFGEIGRAEKKSEAAKDEGSSRRLASLADGDAPAEPRGPSLDWGASIFLSNDDSMSLASAQRLLYAVREGVSWTPEQVRPHELLNYFSFDTTDPRPGETFGVTASARPTEGDGLALAIAVEGAVPDAIPLDLTVLVDRSCSMEDEGRMDYTRRGLERMVGELKDGDRVDVVLFDDAVCTPLENWVAGRDPASVLIDTMRAIQPRGSTDLDLGLREAYAVARRHDDVDGRNRRMLVVTDALLNTGAVDTDIVSDIGKAVEADGIRLTGVGVGRDFNDKMLQQLTEKGKGAYVFLGSEAVVDRLFGVGFRSLVTPLALDVQFELDLPETLAMTRFYGEEASTVAADVQPVHFQAGTTQLFLQELVAAHGARVDGDLIDLTVRWTDAISGERKAQSWKASVGELLAADGRNVDKALALMRFSDVLVAQSMGASCDDGALRTFGATSSRVRGDAEIAFVDGLVQHLCPTYRARPIAAAEAVEFKLKLDSDVLISEVSLECAGERDVVGLRGAATVATFEAVPGACTATLVGPVEMAAAVTVPRNGGEARCLVRGGRLACS